MKACCFKAQVILSHIYQQTWSTTTIKLHGCVRDALDNDELNQAKKSRLSYYNKVRSEVTFEMDENAYVYQGRKLKKFEAGERTLNTIPQSTIAALSDAVSSWFESLSICPVSKNSVDILDCTKWPPDSTQLCLMGI